MTTAIITAVGTLFTGLATILVGYFIRRTDRLAKMTRANMDDQQYILRLVGALREDYWTLVDWAYNSRARFLRLALRYENEGGSVADVEGLDIIPNPIHREMELRHARGDDSEDEGK